MRQDRQDEVTLCRDRVEDRDRAERVLLAAAVMHDRFDMTNRGKVNARWLSAHGGNAWPLVVEHAGGGGGQSPGHEGSSPHAV